MKLKPEVESANYSIELSIPIFSAIDDDFSGYLEEMLSWDIVSELNYSGHFGPYIFFTSETLENAEDFARKLTAMIVEKVEKEVEGTVELTMKIRKKKWEK